MTPPSTSAISVTRVSPRVLTKAKLADYLQLSKPRIAVMAMVTVTIGFALGSSLTGWNTVQLLQSMLGIALVAAGSSALNQALEKNTDRLMARTADRPLPSGRMSMAETIAFGAGTGIAGTVWLAITVNVTTAILGAITLFLYVAVYTPLKRKTALCTAIGAIPGAMPPVLGWAASGAPLNLQAFSLFAILFLWQFPHFLAIAWIYRHQYSGAGLKMLPETKTPRAIGIMSVAYAIVLLPVSLLPSEVALAGTGYTFAAIVLGVGYAFFALRFAIDECDATARKLLLSSLIYLPVLLLILCWEHLQLLS